MADVDDLIEDNPLLQLPTDAQEGLKQWVQAGQPEQIEDAEGNRFSLSDITQLGFTRREAMAIFGIMAASGVTAWQAIQQFVGQASAATGGAGTIGTSSERADVFADIVDSNTVTTGNLENDNWYSNPVVDPNTTDWGQALEDAISTASQYETVYVPPATWELQTTANVSKRVSIQGVGTPHPSNYPVITTESNSLVIDGGGTVPITVRGLSVEKGSQTSSAEAAIRSDGQTHIRAMDINGFPSGAGIYLKQDQGGCNRSRIQDITVRNANSAVRTNNVSGSAVNTNAIIGRGIDATGCTYGVRNNAGFANYWEVQHMSFGTAAFQFTELSSNKNFGSMYYGGDGLDYVAEVDADGDATMQIHYNVGTGFVDHISGRFTHYQIAGHGLRTLRYGGARGFTVDSGGTDPAAVFFDAGSGARIYKDSNGDLVAVDGAGNATTLT